MLLTMSPLVPGDPRVPVRPGNPYKLIKIEKLNATELLHQFWIQYYCLQVERPKLTILLIANSKSTFRKF